MNPNFCICLDMCNNSKVNPSLTTFIYRVCKQSRCISLLNLIGCNKPNVKWNGMELKGAVERHLIARLLDISTYMGYIGAYMQ